jgi:uroporphyrinogen-III decarboxylase
MNSTERVMAALNFQEPDRVPLFDSYWPEFVAQWREATGREPRGEPGFTGGYAADDLDIMEAYGVDVAILAADESPWPGRAAVIEQRGDYLIRRDGWGKTVGEARGGQFYDEIDLPLKGRVDPDKLEFESPLAGSRYAQCLESLERYRALENPPCVFAKVGGPYQRSGQNLRGVEQWLIDLAEDPAYAVALASRVTDHLIEVGLESLRRFGCHDTGIWIYDDLAYNDGVMVGPRTYERVFLPLMARMIRAFKAAGAKKVILHSDGDVRSILDGLIAVGLDGINPIEPKANMDAAALRERYGDRLALIGGVCNAWVLPSGSPEQIREHVRRVLSAGIGGGLVIGAHSIGPDVSVERYDYFASLVREHGRYPLERC